MNFKKKKPENSDMPPLTVEEDEDTPHRESHGAIWVTVICIVAAVALLLSSLPTAVVSGSTVRSKVLSGQPEAKALVSTLYGAGTLTPQEGEDVEVPQTLEISERYVNNGDTVTEGAPILKVDKVQVTAAIAEVQGLLEKIDDAIATEGNKNNAASVKATASGRVKKIYAQKDVAVKDTMYEYGALVLLSLDGTMAMDLPEELFTLGETVTVRLSDGKEVEGTVEHISDGLATVTCSDEKAAYGEIATVLKDGNTLGSAQLYIHSMLRVTGLQGTVSNVNVKENRKVNNGTVLLTLKDTGKTAEYERLLSRRQELEDYMGKLLALSKDGILRADTDGIVTGLSDDVDYASPASLETRTRSQASPGYRQIGGIRMETGENQADEGGNSSGNQVGGENSSDTEQTGENEKDDTSEGKNENPGGEGGNGETEEDTIHFVVGVVKDNDGSTIRYKLVGKSFDLTLGAMQDVNFAAYAAAEDDETYLTLSQSDVGLVLRSAGGSWDTASFSDIEANDALLLGGGLVIFQSGGSLTPVVPTIPTIPGGLSLGSLTGMGSMSGLTASSATAQKKVPAYDSFDTTCTVAATVTRTEEMTVDITVDELDILSLQVGMAADISLDALPGKTYSGTITKINTYGVNSGGNTKYTVTVTLPREENMLTGMNASVKIQTAVSDTVPTVPAAAIQSKDGKSWLYTAYDEKTDTLSGLTQVETGLSDGESVQILSGFPENGSYYYRYADTIEYSFLG